MTTDAYGFPAGTQYTHPVGAPMGQIVTRNAGTLTSVAAVIPSGYTPKGVAGYHAYSMDISVFDGFDATGTLLMTIKGTASTGTISKAFAHGLYVVQRSSGSIGFSF